MNYFKNEEEVSLIGGLMIENHLDRIVISGDTELTLDREGLLKARALHEHLKAIVVSLEYMSNTVVDPVVAVVDDVVDNPFNGIFQLEVKSE